MTVTNGDTLIIDTQRMPATVGVDVEQFEKARRRFVAGYTGTTRATYRRALLLYRDCAVIMKCDPLTKDAVVAFNAIQQRLFENGEIASDTARTRLRCLSSFWDWCYSMEYTDLKPETVRRHLLKVPPAKPLSPRDILTVSEARDLLNAAPDNRTHLLLRLLLDGGLRISEALALKCGDVYSADDRYFVLVTKGKGAKSRDVEIGEDLYQLVAEYVTVDLGLDLIKDKAVSIFGKWHRSTAWRYVTQTAKDAGIDKAVSPHSLRHTHGNMLAQMDWRIEEIGERLGHSSYDVTRRYTRPAELLAKRKFSSMPWVENS